jgi:hypothetical protein
MQQIMNTPCSYLRLVGGGAASIRGFAEAQGTAFPSLPTSLGNISPSVVEPCRGAKMKLVGRGFLACMDDLTPQIREVPLQ